MSRNGSRRFIPAFLFLTGAGCLAGAYLLFPKDLFYQSLFHLQDALKNGEQLRTSILAYGPAAPIFFMALQILQVILAPIPGEASGILGGYLFGLLPGFIYSTAGLTIGSWLAFMFGRLLARPFRWRFEKTGVYKKFNHLVEKGGFAVPFLLFLIPGFPKDSLSYLLGFSRMPLPAFIFIAAVGRLPGTMMLSMQGAEIQQGNYVRLLILIGFSAAVALPCYLYRDRLLARLGTLSDPDPDNIKDETHGRP